MKEFVFCIVYEPNLKKHSLQPVFFNQKTPKADRQVKETQLNAFPCRAAE